MTELDYGPKYEARRAEILEAVRWCELDFQEEGEEGLEQASRCVSEVVFLAPVSIAAFVKRRAKYAFEEDFIPPYITQKSLMAEAGIEPSATMYRENITALQLFRRLRNPNGE